MPRTPAPGHAPAPDTAPAATLLVVDDEPSILRALTRLFRPFDYRVLTALGGREGLEVLERERVDLVISDIRMPGMGGVEFLAQVAERWPEPVRMVLTAYGNREETMAAINRGHVYGYIAKPWEDHDVYLMVRHALERKRLDDERHRLLAVNARMGRLLDISADQFWVFDAETLALVQANRATLELLGLPAERIGERAVADLLPELAEAELRRLIEPVRAGQREWVRVETLFQAGETAFPAEAHVHYTDREDPPVFFAGVRDITERKQWEEQVETYMSALEWTNEHLRSIRGELEARNAELDSQARHLMYGLKGPLGEVIGFGRRLRHDLDHGLLERAGDSLKGIVHSADQVAGLLEDLATFARYTQPLMAQAPVDLGVCVRDALVALKSRVPAMEAEIVVDPLPHVTGDEPMLMELFRNLIGAALAMAARTPRPRVRVTVEARDGHPVLAVYANDGGTGMEAAAAVLGAGSGARAAPFRQGDVGLAICKKVVGRHGGTLWVEARADGETGFLFTLGRTLDAGRPARRATDPPPAKGPAPGGP
jgi:PAS domain S-box-containing protein